MAYLLHHLLSEAASKYADRTAISFGDRSLTYAGLEAESDRLAQGLVGRGVRRGDRVGIHLNRGIESISAAFAILKAGAVYVPIDPASPPSRLNYIATTCGMKALLTARDKLSNISDATAGQSTLEDIFVLDGLREKTGRIGTARLVNWPELRSGVRAEAPEINGVDQDLAYILFTSGSTGTPKGVMLSHLNSLTFVKSACKFFQISAEDRLSNICPLHFDMSVVDIFLAVRAGAAIVTVPEAVTMFAVKLLETITKGKITVWNSVPSALSLLATYSNLEAHDLSSLRLILFAGEPFRLKYLRRLQQVLPRARFCNMYGQTEANSSTYYWVGPAGAQADRPLPIGRPLPNFDVFALSEDGSEITTEGQEGEFYVSASTVALGYWGEPDRTAQVFVRNPLKPETGARVYKTGDIVRLSSNGNYEFVGRRDHMIKSRGYRVEIGEIETLLESHPDIERAAVIPIPDELLGNRIAAVVVASGRSALTKEQILQYCLTKLPKYMVPEAIEFRDSLPTTSSGKIDRQQLGNIRLRAEKG